MQLAAIWPSNRVQLYMLPALTDPFLIAQQQQVFKNARAPPDLMKYVQILV